MTKLLRKGRFPVHWCENLEPKFDNAFEKLKTIVFQLAKFQNWCGIRNILIIVYSKLNVFHRYLCGSSFKYSVFLHGSKPLFAVNYINNVKKQGQSQSLTLTLTFYY